MEIETKIDNIIFYNDCNDYTICEIMYRGKNAKLVGFMPDIKVGDKIKAKVIIKKENIEPYLQLEKLEII